MTTIRIFGPLGTEVSIDGRRYEIVALGEGDTVWRTKCEACETPFFVEARAGYLPTGKRCEEHKGKKLVQGVAGLVELSDAAMVQLQGKYPQGMMPVAQMLPAQPATPIYPPEQLEIMRRAYEAVRRTGPNLSGMIGHHVGDEADTTIEARIGDEKLSGVIAPQTAAHTPHEDHLPATAEDMLAELAELSEPEAPELSAEEQAEQVWRPRLKLYAMNKMWQPSWGPRPGQTGCEVPEWL